MMDSLLKVAELIEKASDQYLFDDKKEFFFELRKKTGVDDFYLQLDKELQSQNLFQIVEYRRVKEGYTHISRPAKISLPLNSLLKERPELTLLKEKFEFWQRQYPFLDVKSFFQKNKHDVFKRLDVTEQCLDIFQFLLTHMEKNQGLLARQIPHGLSTKLIGKEKILLKIFQFWNPATDTAEGWKGFYTYFKILKTPAEFRIYAHELVCQNQKLTHFHGIISSDNAEGYQWSGMRGTIIVENWELFYALSSMSLPFLVLWGSGWKASLLKSILPCLPANLFYWGDMDKEGYEILGFLQNISAVKIHPLFMDNYFFKHYEHLVQKKEPYPGPFKNLRELQAIYEYVSRMGYQIEQEQMDITKSQILDRLAII
ncbi:MAG: hypothetical protein JNL11_01845 [Bdellovibrionaceae bacterium]|nr:hypothetical protein [Pseudobdellovibrionaceae bacterium]